MYNIKDKIDLKGLYMANKNINLRDVLLNNIEYLIEHVFQKRVSAVNEHINKIKPVLDSLDDQMRTITGEYREHVFDADTLEIKTISDDDKDALKYTEDFKKLQDKKQPFANDYKNLLEQKASLEKPVRLLQSLQKAKKAVQDKQMLISGAEDYIRMNGRFENVEEEEENLEKYGKEIKILYATQEQEITNCLNNNDIKIAIEQLAFLLEQGHSRNG